MQSRKIEDENILNQGGSLADISRAIIQQQKPTDQPLNKSLLPSQGLFYHNDISVKKLTTIDIKNLSTVTTDTVDGIMNGILARNVNGVQVNDILVGDKIWLIFYLRSITYDDYPFDIKYQCPECGNMNVFKMQFKDLTVNTLPTDFKYEYTLLNGDVVTIGFPTIGNEIESNMILREPEKYSITPIDEELLNIGNYIKAINGKPQSIMQAYRYIETMDGKSFANFANYMADVNFGVKPYINIKCECGNTIVEPLSFSPEFFMPKIK